MKDLLVDRIVEAGKKLFAHQGFHATGMRDIARLAHVSIGSLYHYFRSKEKLFLTVVRREFEARLSQARQLMAQGLPAREIFRRVIGIYFTDVCGNAESVQLLSRAWVPEDPTLWKKFRVLLEEYAQAIAEILKEAQKAGKIRPVHPLLAAYALLGMTGAVTMRAASQDPLAKEFGKVGAQELAEFAWRALRPDNELQP